MDTGSEIFVCAYNDTLGVADPGSGGPWEWRTLGVTDPGSGGPWEWRTLGVAGRHRIKLLGVLFLA